MTARSPKHMENEFFVGLTTNGLEALELKINPLSIECTLPDHTLFEY